MNHGERKALPHLSLLEVPILGILGTSEAKEAKLSGQADVSGRQTRSQSLEVGPMFHECYIWPIRNNQIQLLSRCSTSKGGT